MSKAEDFSPSQLRKILHLKIFFFIVGALALLGVANLLMPLALGVLALVAFALLAMMFFSGAAGLLGRLTGSHFLEGDGGNGDE